MNKRDFATKTPTSKVAELCKKFLSDGAPHSRKEIENYIKNQFSNLGFPVPTNGNISGGIHSLVQKGFCFQPERAVYQINTSNPQEVSTRVCRARNCLNNAVEILSCIAREIDYLEADDAELKELECLKQCVKDIKTAQARLEQI